MQLHFYGNTETRQIVSGANPDAEFILKLLEAHAENPVRHLSSYVLKLLTDLGYTVTIRPAGSPLSQAMEVTHEA